MPRETLEERRAGAYEGGIRVSVDQSAPPPPFNIAGACEAACARRAKTSRDRRLRQRLNGLTQRWGATCEQLQESRAFYVAAAQNHAHVLVSHATTLLQ